ncbi:MAG: putative baseplate assembly protein, partial [Cyanobacteria bacterium 13_1_40CM_2_61_4]
MIFGPGSDASLQLLASLKPAVGDGLYGALKTIGFASPPALQSIDALRVKASVFGHNAPLKPIVSSQGVVLGTFEWPLNSGIVEVVVADGTQARITITREGTATSQNVDLNTVTGTSSIVVGSDHVDVSVLSAGEFGFDGGTFACKELQTTLSVRSYAASVDPPFFSEALVVDQPVAAASGARAAQAERRAISTRVREELPLPLSAAQQKILTLDAEYDQILPGSQIILRRPAKSPAVSVHQVAAVDTVSVAGYGLTGRVTRLTLSDAWLDASDLALSDIRDTSVYAATDPLDLADESIDPAEEPVAGDRIDLDRLYDGLQSGRWLIVHGERLDIPGATGVTGTELVMLADVELALDATLPGDLLHTRLLLAHPLAYVYKRNTVVIYGNVAHATHGETRHEVLGSGDGSIPGQRFTLAQSPLTFTSASNPAGVDSTLNVRVNEVLWHETESMAALRRTDRKFMTSTDDKDKTTIIFGNGEHGARLPTGQENVRALYRTGIGKPGNVGALRISLLATKPLGVKSVVNPLAATGGADRESRDSGRRNAPLGVRALDRLVSVEDYADFARTFAGIGKAAARRLSDGRQQVVHVTVAGVDDIPIAPTSDLFHNLRQALRLFGDPFEPVRLAIRELVELLISARVRLRPDYAWEYVEPHIRRALLDGLGFDRREIGQAVELSEV